MRAATPCPCLNERHMDVVCESWGRDTQFTHITFSSNPPGMRGLSRMFAGPFSGVQGLMFKKYEILLLSCIPYQ